MIYKHLSLIILIVLFVLNVIFYLISAEVINLVAMVVLAIGLISQLQAYINKKEDENSDQER